MAIKWSNRVCGECGWWVAVGESGQCRRSPQWNPCPEDAVACPGLVPRLTLKAKYRACKTCGDMRHYVCFKGGGQVCRTCEHEAKKKERRHAL